jgi:enoyl-CoA hydratase
MAEILLSQRIAEQVHLLTLNRPDQLNAMTADLCRALHDELDRLAQDRACRAIILTGAGRGFCAGLDLRGYGQAPGNTGNDVARDHLANQEHMSRLISSFGRPRSRLSPLSTDRLPVSVLR